MKKNKFKVALLMLMCSIVLFGTLGCYTVKYNVKSVRLPDDYRIISSGTGLFVVTEDGSLFWLNKKGKWDELDLGMENVMDIKSTHSSDTIMVLRNDGTVYTVDPFSDNPEIHEISLPEPISSIEMGDDSFAAITEEGSLYLWGDNSYGSLGNGTELPIEEPYYVESLTNVSKVICQFGATMVLNDEGALFISGRNGLELELVDNSYEAPRSTQFIQIEGLPAIVDIGVTGGTHLFALDSKGNLYAWGGYYGFHAPEMQETDSTFVSIESGYDTLVLMDDSGSVYFTGPFYFGGHEDFYQTPTRISGAKKDEEIFASTETFYARKGDKILIIDPAERMNIMNYK
jgi:alpha-tubulin suppressor-like RCC1 family protein